MTRTPKVLPFDIADKSASLDAKNEFDGNLVFGGKKFHTGTNRSGSGKGPADGAMHKEQERVVQRTERQAYERIEEFWEPVETCPVCGSPKNDFFLTRFGLDIYECLECSHHYMNPRIKFDKLVELYGADKTAAQIYKSEMQLSIDEVKSTYGLSLLDQLHVPEKKKILDLGCGSGKFLKVAHKYGWRYCVGVDANDSFADVYSDAEGVQFISSTFEALKPQTLGSEYDAITLWNVLEHLYDVNDIVARLHQMLRKDGLLFIMVPNVTSLATRLIREKSATFNWKHVSHFSPKSLTRLMENNGFETVHLETVISEIDNVKSYMSGKWPYSGYGDPEGVYDHITPQYLHDNLLGSRIIGIFRK